MHHIELPDPHWTVNDMHAVFEEEAAAGAAPFGKAGRPLKVTEPSQHARFEDSDEGSVFPAHTPASADALPAAEPVSAQESDDGVLQPAVMQMRRDAPP